MLITRATDYGLRILRTLSSGDFITVGELAKQEELPQNFAYKLLKKLEKAGLIQISRGAGGGCRLSCDLKAVSLYELVEILESNARLSACMTPGYLCEWQSCHSEGCRIHCQLCLVQREMERVLRSRSLHWVLYGED